MAFHSNIKIRKKQVLQIVLFLSGVGILIWQIWKTFQAFIEGNTTFTVSKQTLPKMLLPTILLCPMGKGGYDYNFVDNKTSFFKNFYWLNDSFNLTTARWINTNGTYHKIISNLTLGNNFDENGRTFLVEELMNPFFGICYALTPDVTCTITLDGFYELLATFKNESEILPTVEVQFIPPEDRYNFLFPSLGEVEQKINADPGVSYIFKVWKQIWNYLPSKRKCKNYSKEDLYTKCILNKQIECYKKCGPKVGCNCIAQNVYKTHFEMYPQNQTSSWSVCKTNLAYGNCISVMANCYYKIRYKCQLPCHKETYKGQMFAYNGLMPAKSNELRMEIRYNSMDIEIQNEVLIQESYNFIGTVGGSLGLFIGFSYTGFVGQILDYFIRDD